MTANKTRIAALITLPLACFFVSCTRNEIDFGAVPENSYTRIVTVDTIGIRFSTVLIDSFVTSSAKSYLMGKYKDPYLGTVSATPFFQINKPAAIPDIPDAAIFDSLTLIVKPNKYYYGDTTRPETIYANELSQAIVPGYNNLLYNTTRVEVKPTSLGSKTITLRPNAGDSILMRLDDAKGQELFAKLRDNSDDVTNTGSFLNYFKGISLTTGDNDTSVVYGLQDSVVMRLNYHITAPFPETDHIDFLSIVNELAFNQILTDRSGTGIISSGRGVTEIPSSETNHLSFTQPGTGLYLKLLFPTLKSVLLTEDVVRLLKAELIVRPLFQSFDRGRLRLPFQLYLLQTDGSNVPGDPVEIAAGAGYQYVDPVIDDIYGKDNYYSFNVTGAINGILNSSGSEDDGFFVLQGLAGSTLQLDRIIAGDGSLPGYSTQLKLSLLIISKQNR